MTEIIVSLLANNLQNRIDAIDNKKVGIRDLKGSNPYEIIETAIPIICIGEERSKPTADIVAKIGHKVRDKLGLTRNSPYAAKVGCFVLESFVRADLVELVEEKRGGDKNTTYYVDAVDDKSMTELWELMPQDVSEQLPYTSPPEDWTSGIHKTGLPIIRHAPKSVLNQINIMDHHIILNCLNKMQNQGWKVDDQMLAWYKTAFENEDKATFKDGNKTYYAFDHLNPNEAKDASRSMKRESTSILTIANKMQGNEFFHHYSLDFRGRVYSSTAYLHEQSSDKAKGLLKLSEGAPLDEHGFKWLCIHTSNCWGNDKVSLSDRRQYAEENWVEWARYGSEPFTYKGWMKADKPWSFLHCCLVFNKLALWVFHGNAIEDFPCAMPVFIDGSNNGVQHLTALSKDETVAPLVNLVPQDLPGDVYMYVADKVWAIVEKQVNPLLENRLDILFNDLEELKANIKSGLTRKEWDAQVKILNEFRKLNKLEIMSVSANYWNRVVNPKERRKVTKRPCMTLGYGGTKYGFKNQILEDTSKLGDYFKNMEYNWSIYMADLIYDVCRGNDNLNIKAELPGPAKMLELFETVARGICTDEQKLGWNVPITNFPVIQQYLKSKVKRVDCYYMDGKLRLSIKIIEDKNVDKGRQIKAASPNIIHSFDAAHLQMVVVDCDFPTPTVHDSFGCLPSDMETLKRKVSEKFVEFYETDPLYNFLDQTNSLHLMPNRGLLDIRSILESDFAFA